MIRTLFLPERVGNVWLAVSLGLMGFILSFGLARSQIIPVAPQQVVIQAPPSPPPVPTPAPRAPGCPA